MSISQIISLLRDGLILGGVGYIVWFIHTEATDAVKVQDFKAAQQQMVKNQAQIEQWAQESRDAANQQRQDMHDVGAAIAAQQRPVYVMRNAPSGCSVSPAAPAAAGSASASGPADKGPGTSPDAAYNARRQISAFEARYEGYLASCRFVLNSWPH